MSPSNVSGEIPPFMWDETAITSPNASNGRSEALATVSVSRADIDAIEAGGDAAMRISYTQTALKLYALALRLRSETGFHPLRRAGDE